MATPHLLKKPTTEEWQKPPWRHARAECHIDTLHAFMQEYNFAALVTQQDGELLASHLPFLLDAQRGPYGTLMAHMARANPQWRTLAGTAEVLVIFQGPHTYVSPSWYEDDVALSVPTWNYTVAFEIQITRLEGKFKLSQNRSANDQRRVLAALENNSGAESAGVAAFMQVSIPSGDNVR